MNQYDALINNISQKLTFSPEEQSEFAAAFTPRRVKKRQFIIQPEFVAKYRFYVVKGAFRAYIINDKGDDHTVQFAIDDWWISDYNSYIYQQPATLYVEALEDSLILQIDYESEKKLKAGNYKYETLFRMMAEKSAAFYARRIIATLSQNAEERYDELLQSYPEVIQRLPQYVIASYLNMTTEFLSKIRNKKVSRKGKKPSAGTEPDKS